MTRTQLECRVILEAASMTKPPGVPEVQVSPQHVKRIHSLQSPDRAISQEKMTTSNATLPPMGKISIVGIWTETVLYGMSCIVVVTHPWLMFPCS